MTLMTNDQMTSFSLLSISLSVSCDIFQMICTKSRNWHFSMVAPKATPKTTPKATLKLLQD